MERVPLLAVALLVLAVGLCLFNGSHDAGGYAGLDLCRGMLFVSLAVVLAPGLPLIGATAMYRPVLFLAFSPRVPAPPPKTAAPS